jgi:dephospho-CoA kinase
VPEEVQVQRLVAGRGMAEDDVRARIRAQASREERLEVADYVVDNTGAHEDLRAQVTEVFARLRRQSSQG